MVKILRLTFTVVLCSLISWKLLPEYNLFAQTIEQGGTPVGGSSSDGAMDGVSLQRTSAYPKKTIQQASSLIWKSDKLFTFRYSVSETMFYNGPTIYGAFSYSLPTFFNYSEPVLAGGALFFECYIGDGYLFAVDANSGRVLWHLKVEKKPLSFPAVAGDTLYVGANDGNFYALNSKTGKEQWRFSGKDRGYAGSSPVVTSGIVYFGSIDGNFYALDAQTGKAQWVFDAKSYLTAAAVAGSTIYFANRKGSVYALDIRTGQERWTFKASGELLTPVVGKLNVYLRTKDGDLYAVDRNTGEQKWRSRIGTNFIGSGGSTPTMVGTPLALYNETIFFGGLDKLYAVNAQTGQLKWEFKTKSPSRPPVVADGVVYFGTPGGLYAVDANTGKEKWVIETKNKVKDKILENIPSSPAIDEDALYFVSDDGHLYALR